MLAIIYLRMRSDEASIPVACCCLAAESLPALVSRITVNPVPVYYILDPCAIRVGNSVDDFFSKKKPKRGEKKIKNSQGYIWSRRLGT